jgi:peptidoglycan/LPS O-acetylase OafA/YrhL
MGRIDRSTSQFLDAARWMSAFAVVLAHSCAMMMVDEMAAPHPSLLLRFMFCMKNIGHLAVVIFFVLSGYLVGGQELLRVLDGRRFDPGRYAIQRFSRIYTVLVPALLLTLLLDRTGQAYLDSSHIYTDPAINQVGSLMYPIAARDDVGTFIGNLFMLHTIVVEPFGGDGPLWSLANEWWYYTVFALVLVAACRQTAAAWRVAALAAAFFVLWALPSAMTLSFSLWLLGVGAAVLGRHWPGLPWRGGLAWMAAGFTVAMLGMSWSAALAPLPTKVADAGKLAIDLVPAAGFAFAMLSARNRPQRRAGTFHERMAGFSFSLYAIHFPVLVFLAAAANTLFGLRFARPLDGWCVLTFCAFTAVIGVVAWGFAAVTERNTHHVRAGLTGLFARRLSPG